MDQKDGGEKPQPRPPGLPRMATLTPVEPRPAPHAGPGGEPMCIECGDQQADVLCEMCEDVYCEICFQAQHRKGNRFKHTIKELPTGKNALRSTLPPAPEEDKKEDVPAPAAAVAAPADEAADREALAQLLQEVVLDTIVANPSAEWMRDRSKFVPLRLSDDERQLLLLLEAALNVSEYTDNIDIYMFRGKEERMCKELTEVCSLITGMAMCNDWKQGKKLVKVGDFHNNAEFFQHVFEVGRRHKIRNPEKMRASYGKLLHLLQDAQDRDVQREMKFSMVKPIRTVYEFLDEQKHLGLLADPLVPIACAEIVTEDRSRADIEKAAQAKRMAIKILQDHYSKQGLSRDAVSLCLLSIGDNHSFLRANQGPVDQMLQLLTQLYHPDKSTKGTDLTLRYGIKGSCLSHDHRTQYHFVLQSLTLWRDILHDMFRLWYLSETDMLDEQNQYRLRNTGQGLNRMQRCPRIADAMSKIVGGAHRKQGNWVGLSVVHLGDVDVPNALVFIDKYNQVPRILTPIVQAIRGLDALYEQPETKEYIESFGGVGAARLRILTDFFKHGFDGSGSDGGSCIDGRLTSAWNWCSKIAKKEYYPLFLLTGFIGFDGTGF